MGIIRKKSVTIYCDHIESIRQELNEEQQLAFYNAVIDFLAYGEEPNLQGEARFIWVALAPFYRRQRQAYENGVRLKRGKQGKTNP